LIFQTRTRTVFFAPSRLLPLLFISLCALFVDARAAWQTVGDVRGYTRVPGGIELTLSSGARARITFITPEVVRVRLAPRGRFEDDFSYAVTTGRREAVRAQVKDLDRATINVWVEGGASLRILRRPFLLTVYDNRGRAVVADDPARPAAFDPATDAVESSKLRPETETYYGFGEKAFAGMSRHTQQMVMWNTDTYGYPVGLDPIYQSIGFFIALRQESGEGRAYGLFQDNTHRSYFDMGKTAPERYTFGAQGGELNYYVFAGGRERTPRRVLADYTELTGRTPLPPLWALGNQQSRWSYTPESRVREIARRFRAERIPADVIYLDIDHMDGYRVFTWDKTRFPNPSRMMADLRREGFRVVNIVDPGIKVDDSYAVYTEGRARGLFTRTAGGDELRARVWPGVCAFPDFTNPRAREWFGSLYKTLLDDGVAGFWNDMNEPATFLSEETPKPDIYHHPGKTFPLDARHDGDGHPGSHARYHNVYGMLMARATFEGLRRLNTDARPLVITRAGYAGIQRYSAVWTGDNVATWEHLALTIPMLTNLGVSGVPLVGADVGGFSRSPSAELYARWLQAAALTPFLRTHTEAGSKDQEPWSYGDDYTRINRRSVELRYQLLPYLYTLFREHTETGAPPMRPLWFEYPSDSRTYLLEDQYLVGRDLLVAPVLQEGQRRRRVYFPRGDAWVDWWTGQRYEGGTDADIEAPLERLPLFARVGAVIPTQEVVQHTGEMARRPLSLTLVEGGRNSDARIYQDEGDGYAYLRGRFTLVRVMQTPNEISVTQTSPNNDDTPAQSAHSRRVATIEVLGLTERPREVRVNERPARDISFERETRRLKFPVEASATNLVTFVR
jgi:alpha-glucosidase